MERHDQGRHGTAWPDVTVVSGIIVLAMCALGAITCGGWRPW